MSRWRVRSLLLLLAFFAIAGPGGGGGGGGGSSSSPSSGSYGGSYSYTGGSDYRNYGDHTYTPFDIACILGILGIVVVVAAAEKVRRFYVPAVPYAMGNWIFLLRNGDRYVTSFEKIAREGRFQEPGQRQKALKSMAAVIQPDDIVAGSFDLFKRERRPGILGKQAEALYKRQVKQGEIEIGVENIELPSGKIHRDDGLVSTVATSETVCLFGVIQTAVTIDPPDEERTRADFVESLRRTAERMPGNESFLFFYYAPRPGEALSAEEGRRLFGQITTEGATPAAMIRESP